MNRAESHTRTIIARTTPQILGTVTADDVLAALAELGATADAIADRLRALDLKGRRMHVCRCPVAEYLRRCFAADGLVSARRVELWSGTDEIHVATPPAVAEFIRRFDQGVYLDLVTVVVPRA